MEKIKLQPVEVSKFQPVPEKGAIDRLIREGIKTASPAFFWTKKNPVPIPICFHVFKKGDKELRVIKPADFDLKNLEYPNDYFFNFCLFKANIFFKVPLLALEPDGLLFRAPELAFKVQRRNTVRVPPTEMDLMRVVFQHPTIPERRLHRSVWEIGEGGLSFLVAAEEKAIFQANQRLKNFSFTLNKVAMQCEAEVRHVKTHARKSDTPQGRVGVLFLNLSTDAAAALLKYSADKCRDYFSRLED